MVFLQPEQFQIPTEWRRTVLRPQKVLKWLLEPCFSIKFFASAGYNVPGVTSVLGNFETLQLFTEGGTVSIYIVRRVFDSSRGCLTRIVPYLTPYLPVMPTSGGLISKDFISKFVGRRRFKKKSISSSRNRSTT